MGADLCSDCERGYPPARCHQSAAKIPSLGEVVAWVLDPARTIDELIQISAMVKARCEDGSLTGQTQKAFADVAAEASTEEKKKFG